MKIPNIPLEILSLIFGVLMLSSGIYIGINYANEHHPFQKTTAINHTTSNWDTLCFHGDTGWYYVYSTDFEFVAIESLDQPYNFTPDFCNNREGYEKWAHSKSWWEP